MNPMAFTFSMVGIGFLKIALFLDRPSMKILASKLNERTRMVRAKFTCTSKKPNSEGFEYTFSPVVGGTTHENDTFFKYTPWGSLTMGVVNPNVDFEVGKEYYLDFSPADTGRQ